MTGLNKGMLDCADQQPAHQLRIPEAHIGLGRMHIDVHLSGIEIDKQDNDPDDDRGQGHPHTHRAARTKAACPSPDGPLTKKN